MKVLTKITFLLIIFISISACTHMKGHYKQDYSVPIQAIEDSPLKISIVDGTPVAILDGKVISTPVEFPETLTSGDNTEQKPISIQSIEQFTLVKIKGSCFYFACAGSSCIRFALPDSFCR